MTILRERLLARLNESFPLTILEGIEGSGRRTLLTQWAARPSQELRVLVDFDSSQTGLSAIWAQVLSALERAGGRVDSDAVAQLRRGVASEEISALSDRAVAGEDRAVTYGFLRWDSIASEEFLALGTSLLRRQPDLRVIMSTADSCGLVAQCVEQGVSFQMLTETDLYFTPIEVAQACESAGVPVRLSAAERLWEETRGHPALVATAIGAAPAAVTDGHLTLGQFVHRWQWNPLNDVDRATSIYGFIGRMALLRRFTRTEATALCPDTAVDAYLGRLLRCGFGQFEFHHTLGVEVFVWRDVIRLRILSEMEQAGHAEADQLLGLYAAAARVARDHHDRELEVVSLVSGRDLPAAEAMVAENLWDLLDTVDAELWVPLLEMRRADLDPFPALLVLRKLLARRGRMPSARDDARLLLHARDIAAGPTSSPLLRLSVLARSAFAACEAGDLAFAHDAAERWTSLMNDAREPLLSDGSPGLISDSLLVGQVLVQLDDFTSARAVWQFTLDLIDLYGDPTGVRRQAAHRGMAVLGGLGGLEYAPMGLGSLREVPAGSARASEIVLHAIYRSWDSLDAGHSDEAVRHSRDAMDRVKRPEHWPILMLTYLVTLVATGNTVEIERFRQRHLRSAMWRERHFTDRWTGPIAPFVDALAERFLGLPPTPVNPEAPGATSMRFSYLTRAVDALSGVGPAQAVEMPTESALSGLTPRMRAVVLQVVALRAHREGHRELALVALRRAYADLPVRDLAPIGLGMGTSEEIRGLCSLVEAEPEMAAAGLMPVLRAREYVGVRWARGQSADLSDRERELLALIQKSMSNSEIAQEIFVSVNTVKFHRANLYRKLGVKSRDEALAAAIRLGL